MKKIIPLLLILLSTPSFADTTTIVTGQEVSVGDHLIKCVTPEGKDFLKYDDRDLYFLALNTGIGECKIRKRVRTIADINVMAIQLIRYGDYIEKYSETRTTDVLYTEDYDMETRTAAIDRTVEALREAISLAVCGNPQE